MPSDAGANHRPWGGRGRFVRSPDTAERDAQACRLRAVGLVYRQIGDRLDYSHDDLARRAVERALAETVREPADELLVLETDRLDAMHRAAWAVLGGCTCSSPRRLEDPAPRHRRVADDRRPRLAAIDILLRIADRRAKLLGLNAPTKHQVGGLSMEGIDAEIAFLVEQIAKNDKRALPPGTVDGTTS